MVRKTKNERERARRQVETTKERHGDDFYKKISEKGRDKIPTKFNSDTGREAAKIRWKEHNERKRKQAKA